MPAMLGCSTVCPNCKHEFECCTPVQSCCRVQRSQHVLSGGRLLTITPPNAYPPPQVSPSMPLTFILPPCAPTLQADHLAALYASTPDRDLKKLSVTVQALRQSGWYHEGISFQEGHELLKNTAVGTFLVRNSSDPSFLFSLSVQTKGGPTSVRIFYKNGLFRFDAQQDLAPSMPTFPSVVELVQYYIQLSKMCRGNTTVWMDPHGKWVSTIDLRKPLRKDKEPASLKHLARLAIHKALDESGLPKLAMLPPPHTKLELPSSLTAYLSEYPYSV